MKTNILLLFFCAVSNIQCLYNSKQEYTRIKRAKYHYPSKFFKLPPSSSQITGPFSYTPPPGYMSDSGPVPGNLRAYKVSKKPNNGLGDEDINNLFKYLSKQDLNKIVELAAERDQLSEHKKPYLTNSHYVHGNSFYESQEQKPLYKDFDDDSDSRIPINLRDENVEYSNPNLNPFEENLQRITRNHKESAHDNFDPRGTLEKYRTPTSDFIKPQSLTNNYDGHPSDNFHYLQVSNKNYKSSLNNNYHNYDTTISHDNPLKEKFRYQQGVIKNSDNFLRQNFENSREAIKSLNNFQMNDLKHAQKMVINYNSPQNDDIYNPQSITKNLQFRNSPTAAKNNNNLQNDQFNYQQQSVNNINSLKSSSQDSDSQKNNYNLPVEGDTNSQEQLLFLDEYIQMEMDKQKLSTPMYGSDTILHDQPLLQQHNLREQDYEISYTNNVPQITNADTNPYKTENFADLPLMNYEDSKLDVVNSYNVPHYTVTQVKNRQQTAVQSPQAFLGPTKPEIELAPPRSVARDQSDAHLKAIKIWTHKSKGISYTLHDDGTLSPERPIRPKFRTSR